MTALRQREQSRSDQLLEVISPDARMAQQIARLGGTWNAGRIPMGGYHTVSVRCKETGQLFGSFESAAQFAGVTHSRIRQATMYGRAVDGLHFERE